MLYKFMTHNSRAVMLSGECMVLGSYSVELSSTCFAALPVLQIQSFIACWIPFNTRAQ